jgi:site-specific DNA recombinase
MNVYAYLRYSSANQAGGVSLDLQRDAIKHFVENHSVLNGVPTIERIDEAKSGTSFAGRFAFESILRSARRGDYLVIYKYDRLGRNLLESLQTLKRLEVELQVTVLSCTEPNTEVVRNLLLTMAQEYSRQLGDRCKQALSSIAASGYAANKAAFGYRIERPNTKSRGKFVPVPEKAEIVRRIFEMRAAGFSHRSIALELNTEEIPSPKGRKWSTPSINDILANEVYIGKTISGIRMYKKGYRGPGSGRKRPRSEWAVCENAHEPIVSNDLWNAVRSLRNTSDPKNRACPKIRRKYLWTGFLRCADCGSNLLRQNSRGVIYYGCDSQRSSGHELPCHNRCLIREDDLTNTILPLLSKQLYGPEWIDRTVRRIREEVEKRLNTGGAELKALTDRVARLRNQVEHAERRLVHVPDDSLSGYLSELSKLKASREAAVKVLANLEKELGVAFDAEDLEKRIRMKLKGYWKNLRGRDVIKARRDLARNIEKIEVGTDLMTKVYIMPEGLLADVPELAMPDKTHEDDVENKGLTELHGSCTYPRRDSNPRPPV